MEFNDRADAHSRPRNIIANSEGAGSATNIVSFSQNHPIMWLAIVFLLAILMLVLFGSGQTRGAKWNNQRIAYQPAQAEQVRPITSLFG